MGSKSRLLVIFGVGPNISVATAKCFASKGFDRIALVSRNAAALAELADTVRANARHTNVQTFPADLADSKRLKQVLRHIEFELGEPEVILYNASRVRPTRLPETTEEDILLDLQISTIGMYLVAQWAMPKLHSLAKDSRRPSFFVTTGPLCQQPSFHHFSTALSKASQHSLTQSLAQGFKNVHVASLVICGLVKPEYTNFHAGTVAEAFWKLYEQGAGGEETVWLRPEEDDESMRAVQERRIRFDAELQQERYGRKE